MTPRSTAAVSPPPAGAREATHYAAGPVRLALALLDRLDAQSRRGSEIGGVLLGTIDADGVTVEDFERVACSYGQGPVFRLGPEDRAGLETALEARRGGLVPVGLFRSNTRKSLALEDDDTLLLRTWFADPHHVALLIKPSAVKAGSATLFRWDQGRMAPLPPFPASSKALRLPPYDASLTVAVQEESPEPARELRLVLPELDLEPDLEPDPESEPQPEAIKPTAVEAAPAPPPRRQPQPEPEFHSESAESALPAASRMRLLGIAAAVVALIGGAYVFWPRPASEPQAPAPAAARTAALGMKVERNAGQILLTWDRDSETVRAADKAVLRIADGPRREDVDLAADQFRAGSIVYEPVTGDVSFELKVIAGGRTVTDSVRLLGRPSALPVPTGAAPEEEGGEEAETARPAPKAFVAPPSLASRIRPAPTAEMPEPPPQIASQGATAASLTGALPSLPGPPPAAEPAKPATAPAAAPVLGEAREARLVKRVTPLYPHLATQSRAEGVVRLQAAIDAQGKVTGVKVIDGHPLLRQAAVDAVRQWVYEPALLNGKPVASSAQVSVNFTMRK